MGTLPTPPDGVVLQTWPILCVYREGSNPFHCPVLYRPPRPKFESSVAALMQQISHQGWLDTIRTILGSLDGSSK